MPHLEFNSIEAARAFFSIRRTMDRSRPVQHAINRLSDLHRAQVLVRYE
jgi:hypothetical protein